jgi:predicted PhzF superfamily epimerase YddE/YHI9
VPRDEGVVVQECGAGLVQVRRSPTGLAFAAPPLVRSGAVTPEELAQVVAALRIDAADVVEAAWIDNGPGWIGVRLASAEQVLALRPAPAVEDKLDIGVVGPLPAGSGEAVEVRAFFVDANLNLREDPVTGSLNASVAQWLLGSGVLTAPYTARQGTVLGRTGRPRIEQSDDGRIWVGGPTTTVVRGSVVA